MLVIGCVGQTWFFGRSRERAGGGTEPKTCHVDASIKMTISGYSREGSGSRWWLMLVTREFSYISFLLTLLLLGTRRKSFCHKVVRKPWDCHLIEEYKNAYSILATDVS